MSKSFINIILILSIVVNGAFGYNVAKRYYYSHRKVPPGSLTKIAAKGRQSIYDLFPVSKTDIVMAGDSHTQFYMVDHFLPTHKIANRGIAGETSKELLQRIEKLISNKPLEVIIETGFNDFHQGIPVNQTTTNLEMIIAAIKTRSPKTAIRVLSIFPSRTRIKNIDPSNLIPQINAHYKAICSRENIPYVNVYDRLAAGRGLDAKYDSGDGVHLNGLGYKVLTETLKPYLL